MLNQDHCDGVFDEIARLFAMLDTPVAELRVYEKIIARTRECATVSEIFLPIDVPTAIASALQLGERVTSQSAAICTLLWAGADLMDDASDGDGRDDWGISDHQLALLYTNLLATLPHLVLTSDDVSEAGRARCSAAIADALWNMSHGQFADLGCATEVRNCEDSLAVIRQKTGAEVALFASIPALLAGLPEQDVAAWRMFGMQFGSMVQLFTDIRSTFDESPVSDLLRGKRTLPVMRTLATLPETSRNCLERDLAKLAAGNREPLTRVIESMHAASAAFSSLMHVELFRYRAAAALPVPLENYPRIHPLRRLLRSLMVI